MRGYLCFRFDTFSALLCGSLFYDTLYLSGSMGSPDDRCVDFIVTRLDASLNTKGISGGAVAWVTWIHSGISLTGPLGSLVLLTLRN